MSRLATAFVLGYHGCDSVVARKAVLKGDNILHSNKDYDWLGPGAYFWESDPVRAREWAEERVRSGHIKKAAVVGAVIDLGNCLDLVARENIELLREAHRSFVALREAAQLPIPVNRNPRGTGNKDLLLRFLDCAVIKHMHEIVENSALDDLSMSPFDTVRGMFVEGSSAFPGSGIYQKSHIQIAVRNPGCIKGLFFPPDVA